MVISVERWRNENKSQRNAILVAKSLESPVKNNSPRPFSRPADIEGGNISDRLGKIKTSSENWKNRVELSDATNFTVAGRMPAARSPKLPFIKSDTKQSPPMSAFRSVNPPQLGLAKSPSMMVSSVTTTSTLYTPTTPGGPLPNGVPSPVAALAAVGQQLSSQLSQHRAGMDSMMKRSISVPGVPSSGVYGEAGGDLKSHAAGGSKVSIPKLDDESFGNFFTKVEKTVAATTFTTTKTSSSSSSSAEVVIGDFDTLKVDSQRLTQKKVVQGPRRRGAMSRNPLKKLAARDDLQTEYTEIKTGIADKELKRLKLESIAKTSNLAIEALAGLASVEDFKSVALKSSSLPLNQSFVPYKPLMLLHVKGRRHVQTRLVEPVARSINRGDCFVLVTSDRLFAFMGQYANVIERSRAKELCDVIVRDKDLGCGAATATVINDGKFCSERQLREFWKLLGRGQEDHKAEVCDAGHADEDELLESCLIETNKVYEFEDDGLVPLEEYWGATPKIAMLDSKKILIFDFGSELYIWNGKNASSESKRAAIKLAQELYSQEYSYDMCQLNPINFTELSGDRQRDARRVPKSGSVRPDWCLIAKVTQHMETTLFRQKFIDWPDITVQLKDDGYHLGDTPSLEIKPVDGEMLFKGQPYEEPNLVLENSSLGRGNFYYDTNTMRHFDVLTISVTQWEIDEYEYKVIEGPSCGHFYSDESYTVRWMYQVSVTVRELSGKVSNRSTVVGRDRCAYFCWHGKDAPANEKGAAALLTVELDKEKGAQVRVAQGQESSAFIRLFKIMFIHKSKKTPRNAWRLYIITGNYPEETVCTEVTCHERQLRSRATMVLINGEKGRVLLWNGCKALPHAREVGQNVLNAIIQNKYTELFDESLSSVSSKTLEEGQETHEFFEAIDGSENRHSYHSLLGSNQDFSFTPRIFNLTSINNGNFEATELHYNLRCKDLMSAYPFRQDDLYKARQPTIFMIDNGHILWLWQGWWPTEDGAGSDSGSNSGSDNHSSFDSNRSGENRWQSERRVAMETAVAYWQAKQTKLGNCTTAVEGSKSKKVCNGNEVHAPVPDENGNGGAAIDEVDIAGKTTANNGTASDATDDCDTNTSGDRETVVVGNGDDDFGTKGGARAAEPKERSASSEINGYVVWAGLEPLEFIAMFPDWEQRDDVAEINVQVAPENRSRIYIKNVQLLKKPDVIEQENVQQAQHQHHNQQQQSIQQQAPQNGKIYIRNVSLLQNLNFAQNVENVFQNSSGLHESKYSFVVPAPSPNSQSPPISIGEQPGVNGGTSQRNKIFIRNVDILRNPMIPITPPTIMSTCEMSRTSSSESLYTTPPPPVVSPATSVSSIGTPSSMGFSGPNMVILPTPICSSNSSTPPMIYTPPSMTVANNFDAAQQPPRKSKIFIKNISVLKQPTIHLKSVDELNLMTIDQVQLQNLLPPTTSSVQSLNSTEEMSADDGQQPSMQEDNFGNILEEVPSDLDDNFQDNGAQYQDIAGCDSACGSVTEQESYQQEFNNDFIIIEPDRSSENIAYEEQQGHMRIPDHSNELMDHQQIQPSAPEPSETHQFHHTDDYNMFVCTEDIINLDPPAPSEPESSEPPSIQSTPPHTPSQPQQPLQAHPGRIYVADNLMEPSVVNIQTSPPSPQLQVHSVNETTISPLNQMEQINNGIPAGQSADTLLQQTSCPKTQPSKPLVKEQERTRSRGRPKGAKQTGITKLKKLYTNLTPMEEGYKCDIMGCGVRFRQRETLEYHKTCHDLSCDISNTTGTRCPECSAQDFRTWNTLHTHLWRDHSIDMELYSCQLCNFKTPVLCRLNNTHMKIHSDEKNFICAICNKAFKNNKQLRNHRRTHREPADVQQVKEQRPQSPWLHSDYPVRCVKCDFKFANHKYLKAHMENRHGTSEVDGRIKCTVCGMLFKTRYTLQTHMAKHSDEKRFKCSSCDFSCNDHNSMRRHKMRHDSEGHMYRCAYCDYTSIQSTTYRRHLERMHADVAPKLLYKCSECAFVSISETKYQLHWLKHKPVETEKTTTAVAVPEGTTPPTAAAASTEPSKQVVEVEEPERQCESVNSDVVIVEKDSSEPPMDAFSLIPSPAGDQQFPLIRPAGFANNLSKVDNFYGYGGDQQQQSAGMQSSVQQGSTVQQVMPMTTTTTATTDGNAIVSATCVSTVGGPSSASGHQQQHGYDSLMNSMNSMVPMTYGESALGS